MTPRNVRPSWVSVEIDGRTPLSGGPRAAAGRMVARFNMRNDGGVSPACTVEISPEEDKIVLRIYGPDGLLALKHETKR